MKRRSLLAATATSTAFGLSGCIDGLLRDADAPLGFVRLLNISFEDVELDVTIEQDGEAIIDESISIEAQDLDDPDQGWMDLFDEGFGEYENYVLHVRSADGEHEVYEESADVPESATGSDPCFFYNVEIGDPETREFDGLHLARFALRDFSIEDYEDQIPDYCIE